MQAAGGKSVLTAVLPVLAVVAGLLYLVVRSALFVIGDYAWYERVVAAALLAAELFLLVHGTGYFTQVWHVNRGARENVARVYPEPVEKPAVAVIVSSYHEPLKVIEDTLTSFYHLAYPNKRIFFLDDTRYDLPGRDEQAMRQYRADVDALCKRIGVNLFRRRWHGAKAGMINDFLALLRGEDREGFELQRFGAKETIGEEKYIVIFDADQNPFPGFLEPLVAQMEAEPRLAFIQTPQYYTNFETNRVARAAGLQQAVFYEYICEGKSINDAMFCCGTNVIMRRQALEEVGGFDDTSVTEDFATSFKFHMNGWHSSYSATVGAFGMGPEDLGGYFKQQFRWALGTVGMFPYLVRQFLRNPRQLSAAKWWEYFLSSTYYFIGFAFFVLASCPVLYLFSGTPRFFAEPVIYALFFVPYFAITFWSFFWTLKARNYKIFDLVQGQCLIAISFPVFMKASLSGLLGIRGRFVVTPKGGSTALPLGDLWVQLGMAALSISAVVWGANRLWFEREPAMALAANMFWCLYQAAVLSSVLYFNEAEASQ